MPEPTSKDARVEGRVLLRRTMLTVLYRLVSFACSQYTFRVVVDPAVLGKASIQLELLLSWALFVAREGFRLALTRNISEDNWSVAWLTIPTSTILSMLALFWHLWNIQSVEGGKDADFNAAGLLYCLSCFIEGCAEPAVIHFLRKLDITARVQAESLGTVAKSLVTVVSLNLMGNWPVSSFGLGQVAYAVTYSVLLYSKSWTDLPSPSWSSFDPWTSRMTLIFTFQGIFKHVLTEADRMVLTWVSDSYDQGVYAMGSAYGSLAARLLLQPLEENARLLWSRQATPAKKGSQVDNASLRASYTAMVKLVLYIGLVFACVAVNFTSILLNVLAGKRWGSSQEASKVLSGFCVYTAFMAWNGMTEAFVYSVISSAAEVRSLGVAHSVCGVVFAVASLTLSPWMGTTGVIAANCFAMTLRAMYAMSVATRFFSRGENGTRSRPSQYATLLRQAFPNGFVLACFALCYWATRISLTKLEDEGLFTEFNMKQAKWVVLVAKHVSVALACLAGTGMVSYQFETHFWKSLSLAVRQKQD